MFMEAMSYVMRKREQDSFEPSWHQRNFELFDLGVGGGNTRYSPVKKDDSCVHHEDILNRCLSALVDSGVDKAIIDRLGSVEVAELVGQLGFYRIRDKAVLINKKLINDCITNPGQKAFNELCFVLAHEIGHSVDFFKKDDLESQSSQRPEFELGEISAAYCEQTQEFKLTATESEQADCLNETAQFLSKVDSHDSIFNYAFQYLLTNENQFKAELFAQHYALKYTQKKMYLESFPKSAKLIELAEKNASKPSNKQKIARKIKFN